jgi:hypothetical protein
MIDGFSHCL